MANFDNSATKRESVHAANNLLSNIRNMYLIGKDIQALLNRYQAGTDPVFNAAVNALYTASERTELGAMLAQVNALVSDFETNHAGAIQ